MCDTFIANKQVIDYVGVDASLFFHRIEYWLTKCPKKYEGRLWIYNSYETWHEQFDFWSIAKIKRIINRLVDANLIIKKKLKAKFGNHTNFYAINTQKLNEIIATAPPSPKQNSHDKADVKKMAYHENAKASVELKKQSNGLDQNEPLIKGYKSKTISNINSSSNVILEEKNTTQPESHFQFSEDEILKLKDIWKKVFSKGTLPCSLTKPRIQQLASVWESQFDGSFERWKAFCNNICASKFLMGEKTSFKANLTWLLKDDTIMRIFDKEFGVGDRRTDCEEIAFEASLKSRAELEVKKKIESNRLAQQEHSKREVLREKMTFLDTLSSHEKAELSEAFSDSEFYQKKLSEWRDELSQSALGKMHLSSNPLPSSHIRKIWLQEFAYVTKAPKGDRVLNSQSNPARIAL